MALTTAFLNSCRTSINSLAELTTFRTALAAVGTGTRAERLAAWTAAYSPTATSQSLAYCLRVAIREVIKAAADGGQGPLDLESAYQTLAAEYVPDATKPNDAVREAAELDQLLSQG